MRTTSAIRMDRTTPRRCSSIGSKRKKSKVYTVPGSGSTIPPSTDGEWGAGQDLVGARINHDNRAVGQQGDLVTTWQEGAVGDAGRRRVHRGFFALRHNEQPTRVRTSNVIRVASKTVMGLRANSGFVG